MPQEELNREAAWKRLNQYVKGETLLRHCITVEAAMRHFAGIYSKDPDKWGIIGLLHDIDFELYPNEHCKKCRELLKGWPEEIVRAVESHGYGIVNEVEPKTDAEKTLYTVDELTGLITATAIMRPSKSLDDLSVKSVRKKWKSKGFAAGISREVIADGAKRMGMELDRVIAETIEGMKPVAEKIGLNRIAVPKD